ncbi:DER1-like family member protein 1 [Bienertia sinuspersici]
MDNLEEKLNALTIMEEEEVVIDCEDDDEDIVNVLLHLFLVGKLLSNNPFSVEAMKNTFKIVWRLGKGKVVREIKHEIFMFQLFSIVDKAKELEDGPLSFACATLLLKEVEEGIQPSVFIQFIFRSKLVKFTYERLMELCLECGCLGNGYQTCSEYDNGIAFLEMPYGTWLRASPTKRRPFINNRKNEEYKVCQEFKGELKANKARSRLCFVDSIKGKQHGDKQVLRIHDNAIVWTRIDTPRQ